MNRNEDKRAYPVLSAADWISFAAAPTFPIMGLLTGIHGGGPPDMLYSATNDASPLRGMVLMYLLMSAFHSAPWLKLISRRRSGPPPFIAHGFCATDGDGISPPLSGQ